MKDYFKNLKIKFDTWLKTGNRAITIIGVLLLILFVNLMFGSH